MPKDTDPTIRYRHPGTSEATVFAIPCSSGIEFGRAPGPGGVLLDPDDQTISSSAGRVGQAGNGWQLSNTSSYATLRVESRRGVRYVHPGEQIGIQDGDVVVVPAAHREHRLEVTVPPVASAPVRPAGGTRPIVDHIPRLSAERRQAVAALVAGWFLTDRFDRVPLSSSTIAALLSTPEHQVTQKAVNHKLQRVREQLGDALGMPVESRHMLADLVLQYRLVDADDVMALPGLA